MAKHDVFHINGEGKGGGIGKQVLKSQFDEYEKMGVTKVTVHANIDVGGYAWARFGFVPNQRLGRPAEKHEASGSTPTTSPPTGSATSTRPLKIPQRQRKALTKMLNDPDPKGLWKIADARHRRPQHREGDPDGAGLERRDPARRRRSDGTFQPLCRAIKMTIIFDGPPGTKLGEGETDGMHELLADDDFPVLGTAGRTRRRGTRRTRQGGQPPPSPRPRPPSGR